MFELSRDETQSLLLQNAGAKRCGAAYVFEAQTTICMSERRSSSRGSIDSMKLVEARYEKGLLKLTRPLPLRPGERVNLIVVRQPDRKRWDLERFRKTSTPEERELAEQGLADWLARLDKEDQ